jgi:hypothetical protein
VPVVELLVQIQEESIVCDVGQNVFRLWPGGSLNISTNWSAQRIRINWTYLDHSVQNASKILYSTVRISSTQR